MPNNALPLSKWAMWPIIFKGPSRQRSIALTFDDGPHPRFTLEILDALSRGNMRATFFMTGQNLRSHKGLARRVHEAGHEIANHSLTHARFLFTGQKKATAELKETSSLIEDITGHAAEWFRPPYGVVTPPIFSACKQLSLRIVLWNVNSRDYVVRKQSGISRRVIKKIGPGAIVLFHECHFRDPLKDHTPTVKALSEIAPFLAREGLRAVTIGSLLMESRP